MPYILHIETATEECSVCISKGTTVLNKQHVFTTNTHTAILTTLIHNCSIAADVPLRALQAVALSSGPGAYTALRAGTATAKGLCFALQIPLISIPTLQALASATIHQHNLHKEENVYIIPMIDARRMEVYMSIHDTNDMIISPAEAKVIDEKSFSNLFLKNMKIYFCGNGSIKLKSLFLENKNMIFSDIKCDATHLIPLAVAAFEGNKYENIAYFEPFYLKMPNITVSLKAL
jgi:tRNA threonylcarbamoyladenosine biosynthesis protein TsaB